MNIDFKGKNIIVTGGTGLIGEQLCKDLAESNANILIIDIESEKINNLTECLKKDNKNQISKCNPYIKSNET